MEVNNEKDMNFAIKKQEWDVAVKKEDGPIKKEDDRKITFNEE